ncbi:unnamed protein product [Nyctereutes procyonoides]|uniref:(raccoon dog) hypothetical protein n=1 Tax=Nyctereutes procyonoides TaxID=34880 RepID=A0A811YHQ2_NYCPR|nr:unnamed protein product [Nyctereutes procyonoides]
MDWSFKRRCRVWARRRRRAEGEGAFAELCSSVRGCCRRRRRRRRSMAAPAPRPRRVPSPPARPPARVPGERWSGVGPVCLPPAPSPESRSPSERKGEGAGGGGGGSERPRGEPSGDRHPARRLGGGAGARHCSPRGPGELPGCSPGRRRRRASGRPLPTPSLSRRISVNFGRLEGVRSCWGRRRTVGGGRPATPRRRPRPAPRAPRPHPAPQRPRGPAAPARRSPTRGLGGRGERRGLGAGSRAQHCHYPTQREQCWGEPRDEPRDVIGSGNRLHFFFSFSFSSSTW